MRILPILFPQRSRLLGPDLRPGCCCGCPSLCAQCFFATMAANGEIFPLKWHSVSDHTLASYNKKEQMKSTETGCNLKEVLWHLQLSGLSQGQKTLSLKEQSLDKWSARI